MSTVTASFHTTVRQMIEMYQRKKNSYKVQNFDWMKLITIVRNRIHHPFPKASFCVA